MKRPFMNETQRRTRRALRTTTGQRGFSMLELLIVLAIVIVGATLASMQAARAQRTFRLASAEREFTSYVQKARVDSLRRRARSAAEQASVSVSAAQPDRYTVTMDFGRGFQTRVVRLPHGVTFNTTNNINISFDWRGRATNDINLAMTNGESTTPMMRVRRSGDVMNTNQSYYSPASVSLQLNNLQLNSTTNVNTRTQLSTSAANADATQYSKY